MKTDYKHLFVVTIKIILFLGSLIGGIFCFYLDNAFSISLVALGLSGLILMIKIRWLKMILTITGILITIYIGYKSNESTSNKVKTIYKEILNQSKSDKLK